MTHYEALAREHWTRYAPNRVAALEDPDEFFQTLGAEVHQQVTALAATLAGTDLPGESYLQKAGRLQAARLQVEETVLSELVWINDPELSPDEAREQWELDRTADTWLASWAERIQDLPEDQAPATAELVELAAQWALPTSFFQGLLAAPIPAILLREQETVLAQAANRRFQNR
jgi:hypothetical protein